MFSHSVTINVDAWLQEHDEQSRRQVEAERKIAQKVERAEQKRKRLSEPQSQTLKKTKLPSDLEKTSKKSKSNPSAAKAETQTRPPNLSTMSSLPSQLPPDLSAISVPPKPRPKKSKANTNAQPHLENGEPITVPIRKIAKPKASQKKSFPCALCPDPSEDNLLRIIEDTPIAKVSVNAQLTTPRPQYSGPYPPDTSFSGHGSTPFQQTSETVGPRFDAEAEYRSAELSGALDPSLLCGDLDTSMSAPMSYPIESTTTHTKPTALARPKAIRRAHKVGICLRACLE